jgi:hypothetical protein
MSEYRKSVKRIDVSVGDSVRILLELGVRRIKRGQANYACRTVKSGYRVRTSIV